MKHFCAFCDISLIFGEEIIVYNCQSLSVNDYRDKKLPRTIVTESFHPQNKINHTFKEHICFFINTFCYSSE